MPRSRSWVSSTATPESSSMYASRSAGRPASSGTYAPPAFSTARRETTISRLRSISTPTRTSGPTPSPRRWWARRLARAFSSAYVRDASSKTTATSPGVRATCASNNSWTQAPAGTSASVRFHSSTTMRRSASGSTSMLPIARPEEISSASTSRSSAVCIIRHTRSASPGAATCAVSESSSPRSFTESVTG